MTCFESYRLLITPLSPVHIGTGESFEPTDYVIEDGVLHEFDTGAAMSVLTDADRQALLGIVSRPDAAMIQAVQKFFYERRQALMAYAIGRIPVLPGVAELYAQRIGQVANREAGGRNVINRLEIDRTGFHPLTRQPVLFGSSLKGAIRTALLDKVNNGRSAQENKGLHEFQGRLFRYYDQNARPRLSLELDPMRLVQVSDAVWNGEPGLPATRVYLAVNRKKAPVKDRQGNLRRSQADASGLYQILECLWTMHYRAFSGQLNLQSVTGIAERDRRRLPAKELRFNAQTIARSCNGFYLPILDAENQLLRKRGYLDEAWDKAIEKLLSSLTGRLERGEAFLLRVGRHSGAESVTLNGVRRIRIMEGKNRSSNSDSAKTLWLAANDKDQMENLLPFGWLLVELHPMAEQAADWPELKAVCEPHLTAARNIKAKLAAQQARLEQAKREAEARRRQEEDKARLAAEAEAQRQREEAERQARLVAMSEEERALEEFRACYQKQKAKGRYQPGGEFDQRRLEFFQKALAWEDRALRRQAADLIRQTIQEWTDWPNKKQRKQQFRQWLEELEGK